MSRITAVTALLTAVGLAVGCEVDAGTEDEPTPTIDAAVAADAPPPGSADSVWVLAGFERPESVLWDAKADVYLVSNLNGGPTEEDGNGFISRVSPAGEILALHWIGGPEQGILDAPKGLAILGDTLFVSDIDAVRLFDRETGEPLGSWAVPHAQFLNDLAVGPEGALYATDSDANVIYRFSPTGERSVLVRGGALGRPNGIWADPAGVIVATVGTGEIYRVNPESGEITNLREPEPGGLDGVVRLEAGPLLVSSWKGKAVFRVPPDAEIVPVIDGVTSPADIGLDRKRERVLVPHLTTGRVSVWALPGSED